MKLKAFIPEEYWTIESEFLKENAQFSGSFHSIAGNENIELKSEQDVKNDIATIGWE